MKKLIKTSLLLTALLMCFSICGCNSNDTSSTEKVTDESSMETVVKAETTEALLNSQSAQEIIEEAIKSAIKNSFGENMSLNYDGTDNNYIITVWMPGLSKNIIDGVPTTEWDSMVSSFTEAVVSMVDIARQIDSNANITFHLLNDENLEKSLLSIYNGEVTYNELQNNSITDNETKSEFEFAINSTSLSTDYEGKDVLIIEYDFTNNSNKATSFTFACQDTVFQDGVECDSTVIGCDEVDVQEQLNDIQSGNTYTLKVGYHVKDLSKPVNIIITDLLGTKTFLEETIELNN